MVEFEHFSVLEEEVLKYLNPQEGNLFIDATLGGGGHAESILQKLGGNGKLLGIDLDEKALEATAERLKDFKEQLILKKR